MNRLNSKFQCQPVDQEDLVVEIREGFPLDQAYSLQCNDNHRESMNKSMVLQSKNKSDFNENKTRISLTM